MIERLVENWLTRTNERGFEVPFCHLLVGEGYRVVHLSRHGALEQGKDILALSPDGTPCAYQLKKASAGGRLTLKDWEKYQPQIVRLVEVPISHPEITNHMSHRPYLVTNGDLDEEVRLEIVDRNRDWVRRGLRPLETVTRLGFLQRLVALQSSFWPKEPADVRLLLDLFLEKGRGYLDKEKLWKLLVAELPIQVDKLSSIDAARAVVSTAILCSYALSAFVDNDNHVAIAEGWTLYIAAVWCLSEVHGLPEAIWHESVLIADVAANEALDTLQTEVEARSDLIEGDEFAEAAHPVFYRARTTWVLGLLCARALVQLHRGVTPSPALPNMLRQHRQYLMLLGEASVPSLMAVAWMLGKLTGTPEPDEMLRAMIETIARANRRGSTYGLPDPYHGVTEILSWTVDPKHEQQEQFVGFSYSLESLVLMYARRGWRHALAGLWPMISQTVYASFQPKPVHWFYWWTTEEGRTTTRVPPATQSWADLKRRAEEIDETAIPHLLRKHPDILLLFVLTVPHRLSPSVALFLDDWARGLPGR